MCAHPELEELLTSLIQDKIAEAQRTDEFCKMVLTREWETKDGAFFEESDGLLKRTHPHELSLVQVVIPESVKPWLATLIHDGVLAGRLRQKELQYEL